MEPTAIALAAVGLGLAANQITRILRHGSLFEWLRNCVSWRTYRAPDCVKEFFFRIFDCHLCLGQEVSVLLTWSALAAFWLSGNGPSREQAAVFGLFGPFAVGAVDQFIEMLRGFQGGP